MADWTANVLTVVGWAVTFILGIIATLVTQRALRERKSIKWAVANEIDLSPSRYVKAGKPTVPLKILINGSEADSLHSVQLQLAHSGNKEIENIKAHVSFGPDGKIMSFSLGGDLGAWSKFVTLSNNEKEGVIELKHINPGQKLTIDALVRDYELGSVALDISAPGVSVRQSTVLDVSLVGGVLKTASFSMLGVRLDPQVSQTALLVQEVRNLRLVLAKAIEDKSMR